MHIGRISIVSGKFCEQYKYDVKGQGHTENKFEVDKKT